tara:strand:+ start:394 stop:1011 length:618 start_codon:yes stop_codon:yes gene_type:complete
MRNEQETFWESDFGDEYSKRNNIEENYDKRVYEFQKYIFKVDSINSVLEIGANVGINLKVLKSLYPKLELHAVEINKDAAEALRDIIPNENIYNESISDVQLDRTFDLVLSRGVLIHIHPDNLESVYEKIYLHSKKYILISEYFSPEPVGISYRGHKDKLFKRDFSKDLRELYPDLQLVDYGFLYSGDQKYKLDDLNWFLLEKTI